MFIATQSTSICKRDVLYAIQFNIKKNNNLFTLRELFRNTSVNCYSLENICTRKKRQWIELVETHHNIHWFNLYYQTLTEMKCVLMLFDPFAYMFATNKVQQNKLLILKAICLLCIIYTDISSLLNHLLPFIIPIHCVFPLMSLYL